MDQISFFIHCMPPTATSQGKGVMVIGGKPRFFKKTRQKQAENTFHALLLPHRPAQPMDGPISLFVDFRFPWRKSEKKSVVRDFAFQPISTRPDLDNMFKALADVMTSLRFWNDDGQISHLFLAKDYSDEPGIGIRIFTSRPTTRL